MLWASWSRSPAAFVFFTLSLPARSQLQTGDSSNQLMRFYGCNLPIKLIRTCIIQLSRVSMSRNICSWDISRSLMIGNQRLQPRHRMDISEMQQNSNINQHSDVKGTSCCLFSSAFCLIHWHIFGWGTGWGSTITSYKKLLINEIKYECKYHSQFWHQNM